MYKHEFVEDYIEIIAGYREPNGKSNYSIFTVGETIISLARYDTKVVPSLAEQTLGGQGYTDRQAKLAADLVIKYERQLFKKGLDVTPVRSPQYRLPIRELDRTTRAWVEDDIIKFRFPYDPKLIEDVRSVSKESKGSIRYDRELRYYQADLTEHNLNWVYAFASTNKFNIDNSLSSLMNKIMDVEKQPYSIELRADQLGLSIVNAPSSLVEYITDNLGGFNNENLLRLVDYSAILGYTVDKLIEEVIIDAYGIRFWSLCNNRELKVDMDSAYSDQIEEIVSYARATNRFPIYVYEPDQSDKLTMLFLRHFEKDEIVNINKESVTQNTKLAYTNRIPGLKINQIPLLVSSAGMLFGGDRQMWLQTAEKVVYFSKEVYNKNNKKGKEVCKLV